MKGWHLAEWHIVPPAVPVLLYLLFILYLIPVISSNLADIMVEGSLFFATFILLPMGLFALLYIYYWPAWTMTYRKWGRRVPFSPFKVFGRVQMWLRAMGIEYTHYNTGSTNFLRFYYDGPVIEVAAKPSRFKALGGSVFVGPRRTPGVEEIAGRIDGFIDEERTIMEHRRSGRPYFHVEDGGVHVTLFPRDDEKGGGR